MKCMIFCGKTFEHALMSGIDIMLNFNFTAMGLSILLGRSLLSFSICCSPLHQTGHPGTVCEENDFNYFDGACRALGSTSIAGFPWVDLAVNGTQVHKDTSQ